ncbi:MAG: transposase [Candidatus Sericytochromatia bacterium]|nr:transposase [Candidatus Tanganyikabacteria bacterium]
MTEALALIFILACVEALKAGVPPATLLASVFGSALIFWATPRTADKVTRVLRTRLRRTRAPRAAEAEPDRQSPAQLAGTASPDPGAVFMREVIYEPDPDAAIEPWSNLGQQIDDDDADEDPGLPVGCAVARIRGRLGRLDPIGDDFANVELLMIVEDAYEDADGELRPSGHQVIRVRAKTHQVGRLTDGCQVSAACRFHRGRLVLDHLDEVTDTDAPLPEAKLPQRGRPTNRADGHLPSIDEAEKVSKLGPWGALNHSVYRVPIAWHIVMAPKFRARVFEGRSAEAQAIMRQVAEDEGLEVLAVAAEADHIHLLGRPAGKGGMPPNWVWSAWIGRWKATTSRRLKALDGLADFRWQVGYSLCSVAGGRQSAEEALAVVKDYVRGQGDQTHEPDDHEAAADEA